MRAVVIAAILFTAAGARAQTGGDIDLQAFRPAVDSRGFFTVDASEVLEPRQVSFGLVTAWGHRVLAFEQGDRHYEVRDLVTSTLVGAVGLRLAGVAFELGASAPFGIMSGDRGPDDVGAPGPNDDERFELDGQGLGDVALHGKLRLLSARAAPVGVAVVGSVYLPTATSGGAWLGETATTPQLRAVVDGQWRDARLRAAVSAGGRLRTRAGAFTDASADPMVPSTGHTIEAGLTVPFGAAIAYAVAPEKLEAVAEVFGELPLDGENFFPLEAIAGAKVYLADSSYLMLGGGVGLLSSAGGNPDARAFVGIVFEPRPRHSAGGELELRVAQLDEPEDDPAPLDRDGDRIVDAADACPDDPEDWDDFEDGDGCADPDNDGDRILDIDDLCENDPEDFDGVEDHDGCPERDRVRDVGTELEILDRILFEYDSDVIDPASYGILDEVGATLQANRDILVVEIQGHTDERGSDAYNLDLSQRRAASVRRYLEAYGVAAGRLRARGYGEREPLDEAHTEAAWAKNRRVEFVIRERR